jgi:hypothetical protein
VTILASKPRRKHHKDYTLKISHKKSLRIAQPALYPTLVPPAGRTFDPVSIQDSPNGCSLNRIGNNLIRSGLGSGQRLLVVGVEVEHLVQHASQEVQRTAQAAVHLPER